jgi:hypothetical protein
MFEERSANSALRNTRLCRLPTNSAKGRFHPLCELIDAELASSRR